MSSSEFKKSHILGYDKLVLHMLTNTYKVIA